MINNNSHEPNPSDVHGITPILLATLYGHLSIVQLLMTSTTNPNAPDNFGLTPIHYAARKGHHKVVRLLMTSTTNPNAPNNNGYTPIHHVAWPNQLEFFQNYLEHLDW